MLFYIMHILCQSVFKILRLQLKCFFGLFLDANEQGDLMSEQNIKSRETKGVRLFESDFLEFFTHISPVAVLVVFLPIIAVFIWLGIRQNLAQGWWWVLIAFAMGLLVWPLVEYVLHRFLFHFKPKTTTPRMDRFLFLMHGVHHDEPRVKTRLVMPPVVSIPMAAVFYGLFWLLVGKIIGATFLVDGLFAGFLMGYVLYDMTHYILHHFSLKGKYAQELRRHHMAHHFKTHDARYGVTTWFWDEVFRTLPKD